VIRCWHADADAIRPVEPAEAVSFACLGPGAVWLDFDSEPVVPEAEALDVVEERPAGEHEGTSAVDSPHTT
jgi:hypothetical protein